MTNKYIPPRFARRIAKLTNKKVQIKDISGRSWTVDLSNVDGVLAFGRGWRSFTLDHRIKLHDQVLFRYISGSELVCEIFGINSIKKWQFTSASNNKTSSGSANEDSCNANVTEIYKEGSSIAHVNGVKRKFFEDPCYNVNRDIDSEPNDDRKCLLDLSEFEMYKTVPDCTNGSSSVQDVGGLDHADMEEQINESFIENCTNLFAFEADMRIPCDDGYNGSSIHGENFESKIAESCPSTSAISGTEHNAAAFAQTHSCQDSRPSLDAQFAAFQGPPVAVQAANSGAQTAAFQCQTTNVTGPPMEAQRADFNGQTTTPRDQDVVKEPTDFKPKGFGNERATISGSVRRAKNEPNGFNPQDFVGSATIAKEEQNKFKPQGLGGSVRNVKIESKNFPPNGFGERTRIVTEELNFNPNSFGESAQRVNNEQFNPNSFGRTRSAGLVKKEPMEFKPQHFGTSHSYQVLENVKTKVQGFTQPSSAVTCAVTSDNNYLVLPKQFSSLEYRTNMNVEKKIVFLRDSAGRLWPVTWCRKSGLHVLVAGWKSFRDANGIRTGDECVFSLEDDYQGIFKVNVMLIQSLQRRVNFLTEIYITEMRKHHPNASLDRPNHVLLVGGENRPHQLKRGENGGLQARFYNLRIIGDEFDKIRAGDTNLLENGKLGPQILLHAASKDLGNRGDHRSDLSFV
ncbi:hypothetical protein V2J09_011957 [Rumex salicifolius]